MAKCYAEPGQLITVTGKVRVGMSCTVADMKFDWASTELGYRCNEIPSWSYNYTPFGEAVIDDPRGSFDVTIYMERNSGRFCYFDSMEDEEKGLPPVVLG